MLKESRPTKDSDVVLVPDLEVALTVKVEVPSFGNSHVSHRKWTADEKRKLDGVLGAWARWKVDYVNGFVQSTHCEGTTANSDEICNLCQEVASDESFKRAVRRVCSLFTPGV